MGPSSVEASGHVAMNPPAAASTVEEFTTGFGALPFCRIHQPKLELGRCEMLALLKVNVREATIPAAAAAPPTETPAAAPAAAVTVVFGGPTRRLTLMVSLGTAWPAWP